MVTLQEIAEYINAKISGVHASGKLNAVVEATNSAVTHDSRRVVPGGLFVAIRGAQTDGNQYVSEALKRGVHAIISDQEKPADFPGIWLRVADARVALAPAAAIVHGFPSRSLQLVGVTGTNGKTTIAHLLESIFRAAGKKPALMGTINQRIGDEEVVSEFTTPEASEIQNFLRRAVAAGCTHAVMEVSSHALELHRADQLEFAAAAFTNLTQDHLDLHGTMENYFAAKRKLFDGSIGSTPKRAVINIDDAYGRRLLNEVGNGALTYALNTEADIHTMQTHFGLEGLRFVAQTPMGEIEINSPLVGRPFAYNILCAIGIGVALGFEPAVIVRGINQSRGAAGRFERCNTTEDDITVIVDYAHTPDALENVLRTVRDALGESARDVITVMGCGGDRDRGKRPLMGAAAGRWSDLVIATSDNPRSEDPQTILQDIRPGLEQAGKPFVLIVDRREAIFQAVTQARPGAVVLIAGKGHEDYQILPTGKIHFDDREVAREALSERRSRIEDGGSKVEDRG
jgi:UDP-N-acetylmuramoyl-L-alanyl-D-glutamate--2,6-diaminopimelate ligase